MTGKTKEDETYITSTPREKEVLRTLVSNGGDKDKVCKELEISKATLRQYSKRLRDKLKGLNEIDENKEEVFLNQVPFGIARIKKGSDLNSNYFYEKVKDGPTRRVDSDMV